MSIDSEGVSADSVSSASVPSEEKSTSTLAVAFRKLYRSIGFRKCYNFILFIIFAGAMMGFTLARFSFFNIGGTAKSSYSKSTAPGEWYWYRTGSYRIGISIHLFTILPAGFLMVWQFVPVIRYKYLLFHRINGYAIIILVLISHVGALMIVRRSFGGSISTQAAAGFLVIITTISIGLAYYNIKRLQIDQHRAWMLRAMFYLGTIITVRLIVFISAQAVTAMNTYFTTMRCDEIAFIYGPGVSVTDLYPLCGSPNSTIDNLVVVHADFGSGRPEEIGASLRLSFGMGMWLGIVLHLIGVEIYLALTPREGHRLRQISYERQLERRFRNPGSAGVTVDRWGDAGPWKPELEVESGK